jgi:toxin ParE1/3/4
VRAIYKAPGSLLIFPNRGRPGKKHGTREFVLSPLPYVVVYRISGPVIHLVRILHGAQKWP